MEYSSYTKKYYKRTINLNSEFTETTFNELARLLDNNAPIDVNFTLTGVGARTPQVSMTFLKQINGNYRGLVEKRPTKLITNYNGNPIYINSEIFENIPILPEYTQNIPPGLLLDRINQLYLRFMGFEGAGRRRRTHKKLSRRRRRSLRHRKAK